jgi:hypothetical protein
MLAEEVYELLFAFFYFCIHSTKVIVDKEKVFELILGDDFVGSLLSSN